MAIFPTGTGHPLLSERGKPCHAMPSHAPMGRHRPRWMFRSPFFQGLGFLLAN
ncbi:hypothetical protein CISG_02232 [Coccidioides immitis RMSCC 3703]|uniref:Uncharacterized protein n=1 Tax=Coccidioides immitis RMSCC 3703 TaxID=454286 RepID=A0A0J8R6B7_COCIT|nr:hypothetical protein CISG_02232 [Coccidioides immitis RMSCC 3703]